MAQRSPARPVHSRRVHVRVHPMKQRRARPVRRLLAFLILLTALGLAARAYVLQIYAPGLQIEAQHIPLIVHQELDQHGAQYTNLSAISPTLQHAIIAVEDHRFYAHPGIDPIGLVRAAIVNVQAKHVDQGGSTLEEQLAKLTIVHQNDTIHEKLRTMGLAWAIDQQFSKAQVLELYLNAAYYGQGAYGAAAAARVYFGVNAADLSVPQSAFLAALPQAPTVYGAHPTSQAVVDRVTAVLNDMVAQQFITTGEYQAAMNTRLHFAFPNP